MSMKTKGIFKIIIIALILVSSQTYSQIIDNRQTIDLPIIPPANLTVSETGYINAKRTSNYFRESFLENVPLSTTSFFANQRFYDNEFDMRKPCILDAVTNFYIPLIGNWGFVRQNTKVSQPNMWLFGFYIVPAFDIRIFQTDESVGDLSNPVRTPSLKAGGEFIITHSSLWNYYNTTSKRHKGALFLKGYHHSNGQDGVSINRSDNKSTKAGYINTYNGNFSDDFPLQIGAMYLHERLSHSFFIKAGYEFSQYLTAGIDKLTDYYDLYATERIMLMGNYKFRPTYHAYIDPANNNTRYLTNYNIENFRIEWYFTYFVTSPKKWNYGTVNLDSLKQDGLKQVDYNNKRRFNAAVTFHYRIPGTRCSGVFLQAGFHGQDPYNIYFQRPNSFIRAGVSYGLFAYPKRTDDINPPHY